MPRSRLLAIVRKESREILRDPVYLALAIAVPVLVLSLLALGFVLDVKYLPIAIHDEDRSPLSREYVDSFTNSEYFRLVRVVSSAAAIDDMLQSATIRAALIVPADFSRRLVAGKTATVQVLVDGSFPSRALVTCGYIAAIDAQFSARVAATHLGAKGIDAEGMKPLSVEGRVWFNPSLESKNALVPGLLVISLMFYPSLLAALVVVREKERGSIFNLYCSPVARWEVIVGKALPYIALAFFEFFLLLGLSLGVFGVRFVGSPLVLAVAALLGITASIGFGVLISVFCRTQVAAMLVTFLALMTPSILFSGLMTPLSSLDPVSRTISRLIPASYFMSMVRGVYLKGLGFEAYAGDMATVSLFALAVFTLAIAGFRKKVT